MLKFSLNAFCWITSYTMKARTRLNTVKLMHSKGSALKLDTLWHDGGPWIPKLIHLSVSSCSAAYLLYDFMHIV